MTDYLRLWHQHLIAKEDKKGGERWESIVNMEG